MKADESQPVAQPTLAFEFQPLREQDLPLLRSWLLRPHVAQWWGDAESIEELREDYLTEAADAHPTRAYLALLDGRTIGFIQCYVMARRC